MEPVWKQCAVGEKRKQGCAGDFFTVSFRVQKRAGVFEWEEEVVKHSKSRRVIAWPLSLSVGVSIHEAPLSCELLCIDF